MLPQNVTGYTMYTTLLQQNFTTYTGRSPVRAEGPAGCGHSKIARVCAYWVAASDLYVLYVVVAAD